MTANNPYRTTLVTGARTLGQELSGPETERLLAFRDLLEKWNRAYNLTSVRDPSAMVGRHLLDSLSIAPWIRSPRVLDVGSGGGMPVVPLAIVMPDRQFVALDSNSKKTRFLTQCKLELGLDNLQVVHSRAEAYQPAQAFDQVSSRAFTALAALVDWCGHLLSNEGEFLAMKGPDWSSELSDLPPDWRLAEDIPLQVPGCEGERHLLMIKRDTIPHR